MKNICKASILLGLLLITASCEKDGEKTMLNSDANVETTLSAENVVLDKSKADEKVFTVSWVTQNVNLNLEHKYNVVFEANGKSKEVSVATSPHSFTTAELNKILRNDLELPAGTIAEVKVSIKDAVTNLYSIPTEAKTLKVTPYADLIDPTEWGVVGDLTGWGAQPDVPFWKVIGESSKYVAYITIKEAGEIKFRKDNKWEEDFGDNGNDKTLEKGGANIKVAVGRYKILWDIEANTYTIEAYTWSIIGDGAKGWNAGDDIPLEYDGTTNTWVATNVMLKDGSIKFRFNNDWAVNWGDANMDGVLDQEDGNNIKVTAGTYTITVDFSAMPPTYTIK